MRRPFPNVSLDERRAIATVPGQGAQEPDSVAAWPRSLDHYPRDRGGNSSPARESSDQNFSAIGLSLPARR